MKCVFCGAIDSKVIDSRPTDEGLAIRRRRECLNCGRRFTTYEKIETNPLVVVKKDGSREPFDGEKIKRSVIKAMAKRQITMDVIDRLVSDIETSLQNSLEQEVTTSRIGEMVMDKLRYIDDVVYIRFASVYREFQDIETFHSQLEELLEQRGEK